ncbi:MAG: type II toxin-antitoxin system HipA family toxin [Steroidobacterales bacterium]
MRECFVYIVLPGQTAFVPAARFQWLSDEHGLPLGRLNYGRRYLERRDAVPLDPLELPLTSRVFETRTLGGVFGALRDAAPDHWGRRVIQRYLESIELHEMDYLLQSPDDRAGALGFGLNVQPPAPKCDFNQTVELVKLQALADAILADDERPPDDPVAAQVEELLLIGTSMGGARPKTVVEADGALWVAKFNCASDRWSNARVEHAMLRLAAACGLRTASSRVESIGNRDVLLVKRFDREAGEGGYRRSRMLSALTLLRAGDMIRDRDRWSYPLLAEELRRLSARPAEDAQQLFRRMAFNALISNSDDHPRNHAVIALADEWQLAPAYDLTPTAPVSVERRDLALTCGDQGRRASADNLLTQSGRFLLPRDAAAKILDEMEAQVRARWYEVARREGVSERDCERMAGAFAYAGFRYA